MECHGLIPASRIQEAALTSAERRQQRYVDDPEVIAPSVITLNALSAAPAALGGDKGCRPFPRAPFSVSSILPPLRSGKVSLDETERFTAQSTCQRRYAPTVFGIIPECRSASLRN